MLEPLILGIKKIDVIVLKYTASYIDHSLTQFKKK